MELTHTFTVPATLGETWDAFNDISSVAGCFPGASVTSVEGDSFTGSAKVKLGPIALVYSGTGSFVEKDEAAHRMVIEAKGKDKRGNGTAGATVTASMVAAGESQTEITVLTDLSITGKPAQFGRGVMQDVSDKLLGQFVTCLEARFTEQPEAAPAGEQPAAQPIEAQAAAAASAEAAAPGTTTPAAPVTPVTPGARPSAPPPPPRQDDALDLGATVLPVLARTYWKQALGALLALLLLRRLLRRR